MLSQTIGNCTIYCGDCLEVMPNLPSCSVNMVMADLPYQTTYAAWDSMIPLDRLWGEYKRVIIGSGAFVFTASQPFTTTLISSNLPWFKYEYIWDKENPTNFANAKRQPLKQHENIVVFSDGQAPYYPIRTSGKPNHKQGKSKINKSETRLISDRVEDDLSGMKYPKSILNFPKHSSQCKYHSTQKPVELMEYLIKTYTKEGDIVLDNAMGSGSTLCAAIRCGRKGIGIEKELKYFDITCKRLEDELKTISCLLDQLLS